ncbi:MAG: 2TM domain-containing protein [Candidatus Lokiarchaeota archaeon]
MNENSFSEESLRNIAEQKIKFRLSVKFHLFLFIIGNGLLILINFMFGPYSPEHTLIPPLWSLIPLFGWFIGLFLHIIAYILYARGIYPIAKRGLIFHAASYFSGMLLLFVINWLTNIVIFWVIFPWIFWSIALITHFSIYWLYYRSNLDKSGEFKSRKEKEIEKEMEKMRKRFENQKLSE